MCRWRRLFHGMVLPSLVLMPLLPSSYLHFHAAPCVPPWCTAAGYNPSHTPSLISPLALPLVSVFCNPWRGVFPFASSPPSPSAPWATAKRGMRRRRQREMGESDMHDRHEREIKWEGRKGQMKYVEVGCVCLCQGCHTDVPTRPPMGRVGLEVPNSLLVRVRREIAIGAMARHSFSSYGDVFIAQTVFLMHLVVPFLFITCLLYMIQVRTEC
jgi:hypothetical protein